MLGQDAMHSSDKATWRTEPALYAALHEEFEFTWDLCADAESSLHGHCFFGPGSRHGTTLLKADAASTVSVTGRTLVGFGNPPYSRKQKIDLAPFVRWMYRAVWGGDARCVVGLLPYSSQTDWWSKYVWNKAHEIRLFPHRLNFIDPETGQPGENGAAVNHVLVVWRPMSRYVGGLRTTVNYWSYR